VERLPSFQRRAGRVCGGSDMRSDPIKGNRRLRDRHDSQGSGGPVDRDGLALYKDNLCNDRP